MEENIAILMADLSGYTALTETHGAVSAANLIDKYMTITESCLTGDCRIKERTGDEVMIVAASPDDLLRTALQLMKAASCEENFLQVHGGLHYGPVVNRNNSYFGTTVNLTARIAAKANAGSFWCSGDFIDALADKSAVELHAKGKQRFKNLTGEKELSELRNTAAQSYAVDPVCRMLILDKSKSIVHRGQTDHYFCSHTCRDIFRKQAADVSQN